MSTRRSVVLPPNGPITTAFGQQPPGTARPRTGGTLKTKGRSATKSTATLVLPHRFESTPVVVEEVVWPAVPCPLFGRYVW
jgi:hypothetical protein